MEFNRKELKKGAKLLMRACGPKIYIAAAIFLILTLVFSTLVLNISGANQYMTEYMHMYTDGYTALVEDAAAGMSEEEILERVMALSDNLEKNVRWPEISAAAIVLCVAIFVMNIVVSSGYMGYCMLLSRGTPATVKNIFDGFYFTGKCILIWLIKTILTVIGFILFIVPGFVVLYQYRQAIYIMFDNPELGAIACLKKSRQIMKGHKKELFVLDLSFLGWVLIGNLVSSFLLPVVEIWLEPYRGISQAGFYNYVSGYKGPQTEQQSEQAEG